MEGKIIKSYLCQGVTVNLVFSTRQNLYIIEVDNVQKKLFPPNTPIKIMENYAMQTLYKITEK